MQASQSQWHLSDIQKQSCRSLSQSRLCRDARHGMQLMWACGNYSQKHLRSASLAESKRGNWSFTSSKSFTRVPVPFCNDRNLRKKLSCALYWHQDLIRAMLHLCRSRPIFAPLVRQHLRGVRYGVSRQVQHYLEKLTDVCNKSTSSKNKEPAPHHVTMEGLYKWLQNYCKAWMVGFEVCVGPP